MSMRWPVSSIVGHTPWYPWVQCVNFNGNHHTAVPNHKRPSSTSIRILPKHRTGNRYLTEIRFLFVLYLRSAKVIWISNLTLKKKAKKKKIGPPDIPSPQRKKKEQRKTMTERTKEWTDRKIPFVSNKQKDRMFNKLIGCVLEKKLSSLFFFFFFFLLLLLLLLLLLY